MRPVVVRCRQIEGVAQPDSSPGDAAHVLEHPAGASRVCSAETLARGRSADGKQLRRHLAPRSGHQGQLRCAAADRGGGRETGVSGRRLPVGPDPGGIGGCFCPEHKRAFLQRTGYGQSQWRDLLGAIARGQLTRGCAPGSSLPATN